MQTVNSLSKKYMRSDIAPITGLFGFQHLVNWMQHTLWAWACVEISGSAFMLASIIFTMQTVSLVTSFKFSHLVASLPRYRTLAATSFSASILNAYIAYSAWNGSLTILMLLCVSAIAGIGSSTAAPVRLNIISEQSNSSLAIQRNLSMNTLYLNVARLIGPAMAASIIHFYSTEFGLLSISLLSLVISAALLKLDRSHYCSETHIPRTSLSLLQVAKKTTKMHQYYWIGLLVALCVMPQLNLIPAVVKIKFGDEILILALFANCAALGGVFEAVRIRKFSPQFQSSKDVISLNVVLLAGVFGCTAVLTTSLALTAVSYLFVGWSVTYIWLSIQSAVSLNVHNEFRAQSNHFVTAVQALASISGLAYGYLIDSYGILSIAFLSLLLIVFGVAVMSMQRMF